MPSPPWVTARKPTAGSGLYESAADGVANELHAIPHAELREDVGAVRLDGLLGKAEGVGDLLVRVRLRHQLHDLELARRQRILGLVNAVEPLAHQRVLGGAGEEGAPVRDRAN